MTLWRRFSTEFKEDVVDYCIKHPNESKAKIAREFDVSEQALYKWLKLATGDGGKLSLDAMNDKAKIKALENKILREKNEILARASLYISEHIAPKDVTLQFKN